MKYSKIEPCDFVNASGVSVTVWVSGCNKMPKCPNCWNKCAWDFNYGIEYTTKTEKDIENYLKQPFIDNLVLCGGEFTDNLQEIWISNLINISKKYNKKVWGYSGYRYENLINDASKKYIIEQLDYLIDGEYIESLKNLNGKPFRNSENQRLIDVQKSLKEDEVITLE